MDNILKYDEFIKLNEEESRAYFSEVQKILTSHGWTYTHSTGGDNVKFTKGSHMISGHLRHGSSKDSNRTVDPNWLTRLKWALVDDFKDTHDPSTINAIPWERWSSVKNPFNNELKEYDPVTGKKKSHLEMLSKIELVQQLFKNVWVIQNENGEYNLCRSENDKTPLLDRWYPLYKLSKGLGGKMCLGYEIEDFDGEEEFGTHLFAIKEDGTLGKPDEPKYYIVESVKKS
jgi:hypothetical protein